MVEERVLCTAALEREAFAHQARISPRPGQHGYGHSKDGMKSKTAEGKNLLSHLPLPCLLGQLCNFHFISLSNINICVCNSHIVNTVSTEQIKQVLWVYRKERIRTARIIKSHC